MGLKYLWDTNAVIHYLQKSFPRPGEEFIDNILNNHQPAISIITEMELLCYKSGTQTDVTLLKNFIANSIIYRLDEDVKLKGVEVRRQFNLKLPDAIIAATALVNNYTLISRDGSDFNKVFKLKIINPFKIN